MTIENGPARKHLFIGGILPLIMAAAGLLFYLATLNHWVSFLNFSWSALRMGFPFGPELNAPVFYAATLPLHWLPAKMIPASVNLLTAVCGAITLGLLARAVALLPHDRTHDQRLREQDDFGRLSTAGSWIPPLLAALVLGLQLTIWESATNGAKEMLDLLLFAYVVRCVLEFRVSERESWLYRAAFVYAAGMTENWAFIALLPAFLFSVVWIRGAGFFNLRFLFWLALCGVAGLLFYLILPFAFANSELSQGTFWQLLKTNWKAQKDSLWFITHNLPANILLLLALTSLLPVLFLGIRWASRFGDPSALGSALTTAIFHISHAAFLFVCLWAAFDPGFGPRRICLSYVMGGSALLFPILYLSALSVGYFTGYFLLISVPIRGAARRIAGWKIALHRGAGALAVLVLVAVTAGLLFKNYPRVKFENGNVLAQFTEQAIKRIPDRAVVLSDEPLRTFLARASLAGTSGDSSRMFLDTQRLASPAYYNKLQAIYRDEWLPPVDAKASGVDPRILIQLLLKLSEKRPVYYLHPSFGYYFEVFYPVPHGTVIEMRRFETNAAYAPPLTENEFAENKSFWQNNREQTGALLPFITEPDTGRTQSFRATFLAKLHLPYEPTLLAQALGGFYSLSLNGWGIHEQVAGQLDDAAEDFKRAAALNPNNIAAAKNLEFNKNLRDGVKPTIQPVKAVQEDFLAYHDAQQTLRICGPFDEPSHRFVQGFVDVQGGLSRQAAKEFERIIALAPDNVSALATLARMYAAPFPEKALALIPRLKALTQTNSSSGFGPYEVLGIETTALFSAQKREQADQMLEQAMENNPKDNNLLGMVFQISASFHSYTNAVRAVDHILENTPDDTGWLVNKAFLHIQVNDYRDAIPPLTKALAIETNNVSARFDRAIAYLGNNQLREARSDYQILEKQFPGAFQVYYGLGEIAWREKDTNTAKKYYDLYLANAPATTDEAKTIRERDESLTPTSTNAPAATPVPRPE